MKHLNRNILIFSLIFLALLTFLAFYFDHDRRYYITILWLVLFVFLLYIGNKYFTRALDRKLPWKKYAVLRFVVQLLTGLLYSLLVFNFSYIFLKNIFTDDPPTGGQFYVLNVYGAFLIVPFIAIYYGVFFLKAWRRSALESEKLQKEQVKSQLYTLKNHLDPHFLFNNLNILSSLIELDKDRSKKFLQKFADVYRFMLDLSQEELISLNEELSFVRDYMHLLETRYHNQIIYTENVPESALFQQIPPLTIQMLVENCVKHNFIYPDQPLTIDIYVKHNRLFVDNCFQPNYNDTTIKGSGLKNIRERLEYFTDEPMLVEQKNGHWIVGIPLIEVEEI